MKAFRSSSASIPSTAESYELVEQMVDKARAASPEELDAFLADHPQHADRLRELLPALLALADFSESGASVPSESAEFGSDQPGQLGDFRILRELGRVEWV